MDIHNIDFLAKGLMYRIELSTMISFGNVIYSGTKMVNGKPHLIFHTIDNKQISVNPSYLAATFEEEIEQIETETIK